MLTAKSMKKMLRQMFSVFELEQCLEMGKYSFDRNFIIFLQMELVCFFVVAFLVATSCLF